MGMAKIICNMDCKYKHKKFDKCILKEIDIHKPYDWDGDIEAITDKIAICGNYVKLDD
jgi:hypothetical protein